MAAVTSAVIGAAGLAKGVYDSAQASKQAKSAAAASQVNIPQVSQMATDQALKNIQLSQQTEQQYAPQNAALRTQSVQALLQQLGVSPSSDIAKQLMSQAGGSTYGGSIADRLATSQGGGSIADKIATAQGGPSIADQIAMAQGGSPVTAAPANSQLLQDAVRQAQSDLALGGQLPLDVRNLVARTAAGKAMGSTGNLGLGRDITARDLGLTSLQIAQQRLQNAQGLGQADLGANQFNSQLGLNAAMTNAQMLQQNNQYNAGQRNNALQFDAGNQQQTNLYNTGQRNSALQYDASQAQQNQQFNTGQRNNALQYDSGQLQQANQFGQGQNLNIAQLLMQLQNNDYGRLLSTAQFGQSIAPPVVGLDPGAIANLAVGNSNAAGSAAQNAAAISGAQAQGLSQLGGNMLGYGLQAYQKQQLPGYGGYTPQT